MIRRTLRYKKDCSASPSIGFYCLNSRGSEIIHICKENPHEGKRYWKWILCSKEAADYRNEVKNLFQFDDKEAMPPPMGEVVFDTVHKRSIIYFGNRLTCGMKFQLIKAFSLSLFNTRFVYELQYQFPMPVNIKDNRRENRAIIQAGTCLPKHITDLPVHIFVDENGVWKKNGSNFLRFQADTGDKKMPSKFCIPITVNGTAPKISAQGAPLPLSVEHVQKIKNYVKANAELLLRLSSDDDFDIISYIELQKNKPDSVIPSRGSTHPSLRDDFYT